LVEAKFKQLDKLFKIILNNSDLKIQDVVQLKTNKMVKSVQIPQEIKSIKPKSINIFSTQTKTSKTSNKNELQRIIYTIQFLSYQIKATQHIVPKPTETDLKKISISTNRLKYFSNVKKQLMIVVERLSKVKSHQFGILGNRLRNSITVNVGI
jgi:hypothetical protein